MSTLSASSQIRELLSRRSGPRDCTRICFRTTVISSARAAASDCNPVSTAVSSTCVGTLLWILVVRGTTKTVSARS
jgi:hypothetical protein